MHALANNWKLVLLVFMFSCLTQAQSFSRDDFKIALVGQFIKNIEWPNKNHSDFRILVPEDRAMMQVLSVLNGEVINGRKISVLYINSSENLPQAELIYLSKNINGNTASAMALTRGKGTLVVTENSSSLHNIMINIIDEVTENKDDYQLKFQINRPNIVFENLRIKPDLILHGGTELDVADLYRATELAMQELRTKNNDSQQQLKLTQSELTKQQSKLQNMQRQTTELTKKLKQNQSTLNKQNQMLGMATAKLAQVDADYQQAKSASEQKLRDAEQKLALAEANIVANQLKVDEQVTLLKELESQVENKTQLLNEQQEKLFNTSEQLQKKSIQVETQAAVIDKQTVIIIVSAVALVVFIVLTVTITKLLVNNRKISSELEQTLKNLKEAQEHLIESEKLASLGQLVAGVAHEINTPIGVVVTSSSSVGDDARVYLRLLEEKKLKRSDMYEFLTQLISTDTLIQNNLDRCARLIQNFKQISADQVVAENRMIKLFDYVNEIMGALSVMMKRNNVSWRIEGDNPVHNVDPGLLSQVLNNLIGNAINHAFPGVENREVIVKITHTADYDEIDFIDNGLGMDEKTRQKIFDPFFTTKRGDGGTGLGMNIVHNLVTQKLGGKIEIESELGKGTLVKMTLPNTTSKEK